MLDNPRVAAVAKPLIETCVSQHPEIELVMLATTDGFTVTSYRHASVSFEDDKLAAAASTLHSVSGAVAQQILSKTFSITMIETESGNIVFVSLTMQGRDFVLAMSAKAGMNVATLRLSIKRLADDITTACGVK